MDTEDKFDFWYAVNNTEIVLMPAHHLETFGATMLNYHLISELMDSVGKVRIREGRMQANQPQIITPEAYSETFLEGFGDEAARYLDWLKENENTVKILQYGYRLKQESFSEHEVTDSLEAVTERVKQTVDASQDPLSAVVVGVDKPWDVCLIKLFWEVIQKSAGPNIQELSRQHLFNSSARNRAQMHREIEAAFLAASKDPSMVNSLGKRLQDCGLFAQYEDRFFSLLRSGKKR